MADAAQDRPARPGPWRVVAAVFVVLGVVTGLTFYSMSAYLDSLSAKGFAVSIVSLGPTLTSVTGGLGGLWVARLLPRVSSRVLMLGGATASGLALIAVGQAHTPLELWAAFSAFGLASAFTSTVPCSDLIARWFAPAPARAMSIATSGMSVGGAITPPIVLAVLGRYGLPGGSVYIGAGLFLVVALATLLISEPARLPAPSPTPAALVRKGPLAQIPRRPFPVMFTAFALLIFSQVGTVTHILGIARERGIGGAAEILSVIAASSLAARLAGIGLVTTLGLRRFALLIASLQTLAQLVLASAGSLPVLLVGSVLLGTTMGNTFVMMSLFVLAAFELPEYPRTYAWLAMAGTVGAGCGPLFLGLAHGWFSGYRLPLVLMGVASAAGALLLFRTRVGSKPNDEDD
jgi:MFS family permease